MAGGRGAIEREREVRREGCEEKCEKCLEWYEEKRRESGEVKQEWGVK